MDVCVSLLTGRPPTLRRTEIDVPIPTLQDMKSVQLDFEKAVSIDNLLFPEVVHFMIHFSEAVDLLNRHRASEQELEQDVLDDLARARQTLMKKYQSLGPELIFNIENYRKSASNGHSGLFLMLHLYFYAFVILLDDQIPADTGRKDHESGKSFKTALMACQKIVQILNTAELADHHGYLSSPFMSHCLFVAASVLMQDPSSARTNGQDTRDLLSILCVSDLNYLQLKLQEQSWYFGGVKSILAALERRKRHLAASGNRNGQGPADEESDQDQDQVVELGDPGIMSRYAIPE
ncbi:hypothetical protein ACJ41O_006619 [Fusarium nematophilum]